MNAVSYTDVRKNLKHYMDMAYEDHEPIIITRKNNENVILLSLADYNSLTETNYLLSNKSNAKRLLLSLENSRKKKLFKKTLMKE